MAYPTDDLPGARPTLDYNPAPSRGSGPWIIATLVFVLVLLGGLMWLGSIQSDGTAPTNASQPAAIEGTATEQTAPAAGAESGAEGASATAPVVQE